MLISHVNPGHFSRFRLYLDGKLSDFICKKLLEGEGENAHEHVFWGFTVYEYTFLGMGKASVEQALPVLACLLHTKHEATIPWPGSPAGCIQSHHSRV